MNLRRSTFAVFACLALLASLAGCGDSADMTAPHTGTPTAGTGVAATAGMSAAGTPAAGAGGQASAAGSGGAATAGASGASSTVPATFETVKLVFGGGGGIMPCSAAPCHGVNGAAPPDRPLELPPMDDDQLYTNLTTYVSRACNDMKLVNPGNPTQSALIKILSGPCGMTPRMPYGCDPDVGDCIPDEYIAALSQWIANGAPL